jgi:predicted TPR repeat methyltransferase
MEGSTAPWADLDVGFYVEEATKVKGNSGLICGTGRASMPLLEAGVDLTCVDASERMLARVLKRGCTRASSRPGC